jgi:hypothetical protein
MAAGDDHRRPRAEDAPEASVEVEEIRRSMARGGRPRVGRRLDAVMQTAKAKQVPPGSAVEPVRPGPAPPERAPREDELARWESPDEQAGDEPRDPATGTATFEEAAPGTALPPRELTPTPTPDHVVGRGVQGVAWPPNAAALLLVAMIALLTFGLGMVVGGLGRPAPGAAPAQTAGAPSVPAPPAAAAEAPVTAPAPKACLDTARFGDEVVSLFTANIRDRRLDDALGRYAAASRQCRQAASQDG